MRTYNYETELKTIIKGTCVILNEEASVAVKGRLLRHLIIKMVFFQ